MSERLGPGDEPEAPPGGRGRREQDDARDRRGEAGEVDEPEAGAPDRARAVELDEREAAALDHASAAERDGTPGAEGPRPGEREVPAAPPVWRVYASTLLILPLTIWMSAMLAVLPPLVSASIKIARGELLLGDLGPYAQRFLNERLDSGLYRLCIGVLSNVLAFTFVSLLAATRPRSDGSPAPTWTRLRLRPVPAADVALAVIGLIGVSSAMNALIALFSLQDVGGLGEMKATMAALSLEERALLSLLVAFGAGTAEELYFRGYLLTRFELAHGPRAAIFLSSLAFGAFHWDWVHSPVAFAMGVYLAIVVRSTGSLSCAIAAHVANNLVAVLFVDAELGVAGPELSLILGLSALVVSSVGLRRRHQGRAAPAVW